jgi:hypothetical protein
MEVSVMNTIKRRVQIENDLYFEYEIGPHRAIIERRSKIKAYASGGANISCQASNEFLSQSSIDDAQLDGGKRVTGLHIPFKQVRLKGQINPLKPPLHVETVLIGRALGQPTGYLAGVGFRSAMRVDPEPRKGSRTISPRFVRSISASCSIAVGFTVG